MTNDERLLHPPPAWRGRLLSLAIVGLFVVAWLLYPKFYEFSDPTGYLLRAWGYPWPGLAFGEHHFDHRLGLLAPHRLTHELFGVSVLSSFLPQLGFLLLTLAAVLHCCENSLQKIIAAAALLPLIPAAANIYPDLGAACFMFLAVLALTRRRGALDGCAFSLCAFYAFLVKAVAYFLIVPYVATLLVFVLGTWRRDNRSPLEGEQAKQGRMRPKLSGGGYDVESRFFIASLITGLALLIAYAILCHYLYGDAFSRFHALNLAEARHRYPSPQNFADLLQRLFVGAPTVFYRQIGPAIAFGALAALAALSGFKNYGRWRLMGFYLLAGIAFAAVTPVSLESLRLMDLSNPRHFLFLAPPAAVLTAKLAGDLFIYSRSLLNWCPSSRRAVFLPALSLLGSLAMLAAVAEHGGPQLLRYDREQYTTHQLRALAAQLMLENEQAMLVLADPRTHRHFRIYVGLEDPAPYRRAVLCDPAPLQGDFDAVVFIDKPLSAFLSRAYGEPDCRNELQTLALARGFTVIADDARRYLAVSPGLLGSD